MSIRIFGSGGGVITDATAAPDVVRKNEIFYNNDGRQVGTNPNVTKTVTKVITYTGDLSNIPVQSPIPEVSIIRFCPTAYLHSEFGSVKLVDGKYVIEGVDTSMGNWNDYIWKNFKVDESSSDSINVPFLQESLHIPTSAIASMQIGSKIYKFSNTFNDSHEFVCIDGDLGYGSVGEPSGQTCTLTARVLITVDKGYLRYIHLCVRGSYQKLYEYTFNNYFTLYSLSPVKIIYTD